MPGHRKRRQFKQTDAFTRGMVIGLKRAVIVAVYACGVDVEKGPIRQQLWNAPPCDNVESGFGAQSRMIPGDEDPDKTITTKIITSEDVVSELSESTLEDFPVIQKSEECRQQEIIQTGCVAEEGELIASDNGCGTSVLYKIKRTEGECPQGDIQSENSTPGIISKILHGNKTDLGELQCDGVADFSDSARLSGTTAAIQLDGTELGAPWKCDKTRWSKHPEVGAGNPTERDRALDALWKSDDNVCDAEVARNVSAPSSAIRFKKFTALCVVGTKKPRFEGFGKREPLEQENGKPKEEKGGHDMDSVDQVDESTVKIGNLQPRRGRKRRKRNTNDHNPLYIAATECSQGEFKISDESIVGTEIWPPSCGEPPPCARQRDQSMASALVESGKKARVEMWFCKQGLVLTLPLHFREADDPHVARDVREIKGPLISALGKSTLFGTKRIEKGAVKRCRKEVEKKWASQEKKTWQSGERSLSGDNGTCSEENGGDNRRSSCRSVRPLLREVFASCDLPLDLQAWLFGVGLHPEAVKLTSVAKATIYKYHLGLELGNASQHIDLPTLWERTLAVHRWRSLSRGGRHQ
ncbi:hypothetical protein LAZ67_23001378 [Cordylochernes scorpioides]|uniref:Uncharacterized protein n=2 Tax=Cordylochernes scorpioides TaxID=51811 RepID=A0ABY6LVF9_9ARAC|nr:hypothetical protein LAZ67_23001378 [Cordylochernes scorpioides]